MVDSFSIGISSLENSLKQLLQRIESFDADANSAKNLLDPFAAALESALFNFQNEVDWLAAEQQRLRQKSLMNAIGDLQQEIIGLLPGWTSYASGTDMPDAVGTRGNQKIIAEIKNKHNTMNHNSSIATYDRLAELLERDEFKDHIAIVVTLISPPMKNVNWKFFSPGTRESRNDILIMSGRVFYALATDPRHRIPNVDVRVDESMENWESWNAIDQMVEAFWTEVENQTKFNIPDWVKTLAKQSLN